jgi:hypothetical protein
MKKFVFGILFFIAFILSAMAIENTSNTIIFNGVFGIGTFSAGEYDGGSAFLGSLISVEWIPNGKIGLSYGIESGLNGGQTQDNIILGIPMIFRFGWYPNFIKIENFDILILGKVGWAFGIWGSHLDKDSTPNGVVGGINLGGRYWFTQRTGVYTEIGYNYYGLARNSKHPEYPLGYGSGKIYASVGLSLKYGSLSIK